jgi:hyperosmotically inducible protein
MNEGLTSKPFGVLAVALLSSVAMADSTRVDNSAVNKRDRQDSAITAGQQTLGSQADVELTRKVREALMNEKGLSVYGQNVKIITLANVMTLRGPVKSASERSRIARIADEVSGDAVIKNEIEISAR